MLGEILQPKIKEQMPALQHLLLKTDIAYQLIDMYWFETWDIMV